MSTAELSIEQVAEFLREYPEFFEHHPDVLLNIEVPHPHGGRTVSIPERQLIATRERVKLLEAKLTDLIQFGAENDALSDKVHALTLKLIGAANRETTINTLYLDLLDAFQIPHVIVRIWHADAPSESPAPEFTPVTVELTQFVEAMTAPYVGGHPVYETNLWFGEHAPHLKSYAMVPLKTDRIFGVLLLASENSERFYTGMGTMFLSRIGDVFAYALAKHLDLHQAD
ncbi:hypothetical protein AEM42_13800 [Betaproteobacteria bacterium UKL13-2]|nr:hypothetical protein AEM42_13800 [Betaproteobacteria bacterium UKL13-2]HCG54171.1 DUF484 domain-containing protein [Betaproteobacteria bacterium]